MEQLFINKGGDNSVKKKIISVLTTLFLLTMNTVSIASAENDSEVITIYVAANGLDTSPGTVDKPLKTLAGAKEKVSQLRRTEDKKVEVVFRGGEYRFTNSVEFTGADSGTEEKPVVYKAYDGEKVEFKGSVEVDAAKGKMVTDKAILDRMYESVHNKVVCFDLNELGLSQSMIRQPGLNDGWRALVNGEVNSIYLDGTEQTVAEWPNGEGKYARWENTVDAVTIKYTQNEPNRWENANNFWLGGYNSYDYYYIRQSVKKVDTKEKSISIHAVDNSHKFTSYQSRRWKAINLLEEIDVPGEYYIDPENMKLYIYPTKSLKNTKMEISWLNYPMIKLTEAQNITFEGITFTQTRGDAVTATNIKNIDVINCTFKDISGKAIAAEGTSKAKTDNTYWQVCDVDGSYDCDIKGNIFNNIGGPAIELHGGNTDTLKKSNNVIEDNMIYRANILSKNSNTILLWGVGHTVIHNNISRCPFQAIRFYGNDNIIQYNEIYNVDQESDDCGAIYCGRNSIQRGTDISYNFIHDLQTTERLPFGFQSAIYWDDKQTGISAHHNILLNAPNDLSSNGSIDCSFTENISIDITSKRWHFINGGYSVNHNGGDKAANYKFGSYILDPELYYSRYPTLKEIFAFDNNTDPRLAKYNKLKNNLTVNCVDATTGTNTLKYGDISGNLELTECNDFVNPEKMDYRIKSDSETAKRVNGILTDKFDIEKIGLNNNITLNSNTAPFKYVYPQNGETAIQSSSIEFLWENAFGATKYRLQIAADPQFDNVVYDEIVPYNSQKVEGLKNNETYYWKVTAINSSRDLFSEWESESKVYSFRTAKFDKINTTYLNEEINKLSKDLTTIDEGKEPGQYPVGTVDKFYKLIKRANLIKNSKLGIVRQNSIDSVTSLLSSSLNKIGSVNKGFLDITKYIDTYDKWDGSYTVENGSYTVASDPNRYKMAGTKTLKDTTGSCIYSFDAKIDTASYAIIALAKYIDMPPYSEACTGYSICIKDDVVELQKSTGTTHTLDLTVNRSFANDGKYHNIQFGFVNIGIGNIVVLYVDGESWIEYIDVSDDAVNVNCELAVFVNSGEADAISIKVSSMISTADEFDKLLERNCYKAAKNIIDSFDAEVMLFQNNATKIMTPKGVYDVSYAPNTEIDGKLMIAFDKIDDIWGVQTVEENGIYYIINDVKTQIKNVSEKNGYVMVSLEEIFEILGRENVASSAHSMIIDGNIIYMNNVEWLNKASELLELLKDYTSDYIF